MDVGHGSAIIIEKGGEAIIYDTGAAWGQSSIAKSVLEPVLRKRNLTLAGLILSMMTMTMPVAPSGWLPICLPAG